MIACLIDSYIEARELLGLRRPAALGLAILHAVLTEIADLRDQWRALWL